jgi:ketosteroid isomerase-like protein
MPNEEKPLRGLIEARFRVTCVALFVGALFTVSQSCGAQLPPAQRDSIQAQVQAALDSLTDAWRRWDVDGMMRFYLDSALVAANGRLSSQSEEAAAVRRRAVLGQRIGPFRPIRFDVLSRDAVVVSWMNAFAVIDTGGRVRPTLLAVTTDVWVRRGRAWRILVQHESTRLAPDSVALPPAVVPTSESDQLDELLKDVPER